MRAKMNLEKMLKVYLKEILKNFNIKKNLNKPNQKIKRKKWHHSVKNNFRKIYNKSMKLESKSKMIDNNK